MQTLFNITSFQLLNSQTPTTRYLLTLVTITPLSNTTLEDFDINSIKQDANLAVSEATTFLSITSSAVTDASGNPITDVIVSSALVSVFTQDSTPPTLLYFTLDLNTSSSPS